MSLTYCGALKLLDPVVAYLDSIVVTLLLNDPEAADNDPLVAYSEALVVLNELVSVNTVESNPSNKSALDAYDAEAIEPEIVMLPEVMMLPVTVSDPEMYGELSIILLIYS